MLLGIWKSYEELEDVLTLSELVEIITFSRENKHEDRKFFAALQGVDLDKNSTRTYNSDSGDPWEDLQAKVHSNGQAANAKDILALQGQNAQRKGFGIGLGLEYAKHGGDQPKSPYD